MVSEELLFDVKKGLSKGVPIRELSASLVKEGYSEEEVKEAFQKVTEVSHVYEGKKFHESEEFHGKREKPPKWKLFAELVIAALVLALVLGAIAYVMLSYWEGEQVRQLQLEVVKGATDQLLVSQSDTVDNLSVMECTDEASCGKVAAAKAYVMNIDELLIRIRQHEDEPGVAANIWFCEGDLTEEAYREAIGFAEGSEAAYSESEIESMTASFRDKHRPFQEAVVGFSFDNLGMNESELPKYLPRDSLEEYYKRYFPAYCEKHYLKLLGAVQEEEWTDASFEVGIVERCMVVYNLS